MASTATRQVFNERLFGLKRQIIEMAARAESMLGRSARALNDLDASLAGEVIAEDDIVDRMELALQEECILSLALDGPMAGDLRRVGAAMKVASELERIADLSVDIARIAATLERELAQPPAIDVMRMAAISRMMLRSVTQAFSAESVNGLDAVVDMEDEVDELHRVLGAQVRQIMVENPDSAVAGSWALLALHHIERTADHAMAIAESVQFVVTGQMRAMPATHRTASAAS